MRRFSKLAAALLPLAAIGFGVSTSTAAPGANGAERVRVFVAYKDGQRSNASRALAAAGAEVHYDFQELRSYAVTVPAASVAGLARNPAIDYVDEDSKRYPMAQTTPYGIDMVQAPLLLNALNNLSSPNTTVCIIDSGLERAHEDLSGNLLTGEYDSGTGWWYTDENHHGTHVAGTIAAVANDVGVVGVVPNQKIRLHIVKVFGADGWAYSSSLVTALQKCVDKKATGGGNMVVSMSLGGNVKNRTEENAFKSAYSKGLLSIAAAGNAGNKTVSYPAGYASVVSVAAIDEAKAKASFSQYNSDVEIAAPGVAVLSTVPMGTGSTSSVTSGTTAYDADALDGSPSTAGTASTLFDCGLATADCTGAGGKICLIQRGTNTFAEKVINCQDGGGIGAIIYNNTTGALLGTLNGTATSIPSVGVSLAAGGELKSKLGAPTTIQILPNANYAKFDGTSMATPHVSGVAALVWSLYPRCTNQQIRDALNANAEDLGTKGRDASYGFGLVRAKATADSIATANTCP